MATADFFVGLAEALLDVLRPLEQAVQTADGFESLLLRYGWQTPADQAYITEIQNIFALTTDIDSAVQLIESTVTRDDFSLDDAVKALQQVVEIIQKIRILATSPPAVALPEPLNDQTFWPTFANDLWQDLFVGYLQVFWPAIYAPFHLLGVVDEETVQAKGAAGRIDYVRRTMRWDRLGKMFSDPRALVVDVYGWGTNFLYERFTQRLQRTMLGFGLPASLYGPLHPLTSDYYSDTNPVLPSLRELRVPFWIESQAEFGYAEIGFALLPIPPADNKNGAPSGFLIGPYLRGGASGAIPLGGPVALNLYGGLDADAPVGLEIRPTGTGIRLTPDSAAIDASMTLKATPVNPWIVLGTPNTHRIELKDLEFGLHVSGTAANPNIEIFAKTSQLSVILQFEDGDGFLQNIFGTNPQSFFVGGRLGWSTETGLQFSGDAGISIAVAIGLNIADVIQIPMLYLLADVTSGKYVELALAVDARVTLGPISGSVEKLGVKLVLTPMPKNAHAGAFGDLDVDFAFKSPIGIGVALDAGPITGGGFIEFDPVNGRYTGVLALSLYSIQVKAIGLLDTKLPGGESGYSFLIIISVEFNPIQLGFGFTLNGVGGLCGINRNFVTESIQAGLRQHSLDHILFPRDPIKNAPAIISDLRTVFPPLEGRYVFGPMLELGWGGGIQLVTAELGVILSIPSPVVIVILGQLNVKLPKPDAPAVELYLDVLGVIDFGKKLFSLDATLHDSRIVAFTVYGDMAMRLSWGDNPNFALSIGGLNPHYQPPAGFPTLKRLTLALKSTDNFRLTIQTYFAITSNTFQLGAQAELYIGVGAYNVYGWLGFDALIHFDPFSFIVDFTAGLALRSGTSTVLGISLDGELSGPTPWHAKGNAHVSVLFFEISVHVDVTWGGQPSQISAPQVDAWPQLHDAIANVANWSGALPASVPSVVTLAKPPTDTTATVLVDPNGVLTMRERVLPLNQTLTKFGEAVPGPQNTFALDHVSLGGQSVPFTIVRDKFAPAQFEAMSDQDKLSRPSFEDRDAGFTIADGQIKVGTSFGRDIAFDDIYVDDKAPPPTPTATPPKFTPTMVLQLLWALSNAAANSALRALAMGKYAPPPTANQLITFQDEHFVVTTTNTLAQRTDITSPVSKGEAYQALATHLATHPGERGQLQIVPLYEVSS